MQIDIRSERYELGIKLQVDEDGTVCAGGVLRSGRWGYKTSAAETENKYGAVSRLRKVCRWASFLEYTYLWILRYRYIFDTCVVGRGWRR